MSRMNDLALALGEGLGGGVSSYMGEREAMRLRKIQEQQIAQQDEDRRRQMALQNLAFAKDEATGYRQGGDLSAAAGALQRVFDARNAFDGGNRVGPKLIGTPVTTGTGHEAARPAGLVGPVPEGQKVVGLDPSRPDWKNPSNSKVIDAYLGYKPAAPKVEVRQTGNGGYLKITTNPDGTVSVDERKGTAKAPTLKQDPVTGEWFTPAAGATTHVKPVKAAKGRAGKAPDPLGDGGKLLRIAKGEIAPYDSYNETPAQYEARLAVKVAEVNRRYGRGGGPAPRPQPAAPKPATPTPTPMLPTDPFGFNVPAAPGGPTLAEAKRLQEFSKKHGFVPEGNP